MSTHFIPKRSKRSVAELSLGDSIWLELGVSPPKDLPIVYDTRFGSVHWHDFHCLLAAEFDELPERFPRLM